MGLARLSEKNQELDTSFYTKYFGGDVSPGAKQVCLRGGERFLSQLDERVRSLQDALDQKNIKTFVHFAHQLKGSFLTMGGTRLVDIFEQLEDNAEQTDFKLKQRLLDEAKNRVEIYKFELEDFMKSL